MKRFSSMVVVAALLGSFCSRREQAINAGSKRPTASSPAARAVESAASPAQGGVMPDYKAALLDGTTFSTYGERGNVVLLNLWATWCGPCRAEVPALLSLHERFAGRGFKVVGISLDDPGDEPAVRDFVREQKITYPVALDKDGTLSKAFHVSVLPTSMLIDRQGRIVWQDIGMLSKDNPKLVGAIESALGKKS